MGLLYYMGTHISSRNIPQIMGQRKEIKHMTAKILLETCVNKGELIIHVCNIYNDEEETVMTAADIKDNDMPFSVM